MQLRQTAARGKGGDRGTDQAVPDMLHAPITRPDTQYVVSASTPFESLLLLQLCLPRHILQPLRGTAHPRIFITNLQYTSGTNKRLLLQEAHLAGPVVKDD